MPSRIRQPRMSESQGTYVLAWSVVTSTLNCSLSGDVVAVACCLNKKSSVSSGAAHLRARRSDSRLSDPHANSSHHFTIASMLVSGGYAASSQMP